MKIQNMFPEVNLIERNEYESGQKRVMTSAMKSCVENALIYSTPAFLCLFDLLRFRFLIKMFFICPCVVRSSTVGAGSSSSEVEST